MAGRALARGVIEAITHGDVTFSVAGPADEPDVRRLLRENPLGGRFEISLEREPDAFASDFGLSKSHVFIIAREGSSGAAIGVCERVVRECFVGGEVRALPYIGALRVAVGHRKKIGVLRGGFEALRQLAERPGELPYALTSITSNNEPARRLLTAGLPGLPLYQRLDDFSTFALRARRMRIAPNVAPATAADIPDIAAFLQNYNAGFQFAQVWSEANLSRIFAVGLKPEHFIVARVQGRIRGCLAVWDQQAIRQTVIRRYPPLIGRLRPLINSMAALTRWPRFPAPAVPLNQAVLSHLAVEDDNAETFLALVAAGLDQLYARGFEVGIAGFASSRPWRGALMRRHRAMEYRTTLYLAHRHEDALQVASLMQRVPHPELGLL